MIENINKIWQSPYTVIAAVIALCILQIFSIPTEVILAVIVAWQTMRHGLKRGGELMLWMVLPLIALVFDHRSYMLFVPCIASCLVTFIIAALRKNKISWSAIIYGTLAIGATVSVAISIFFHPADFWQKQLSAMLTELSNQLNVSSAELNAAEQSYGFKLMQQFFIDHATAMALGYKLIWTLVYTAIAENIFNRSQRKKSKKVTQKNYPSVGVIFLAIGFLLVLLNKNISIDVLIFNALAFACLGFARTYQLLNKRKSTNMLFLLYFVTLIIPTIIGIPLAIYGFTNTIKQLFKNSKKIIIDTTTTTEGEVK
jgi:hypothetical protein